MITPGYGITSTERVLPRLALDFTTASLDPRVTVTRALNTATRINSSGALEIVNANLPRFDYTLNTGGVCKGLLVEESRINLTTYSNDFTNVAWLRQAFGTASIPALTANYAVSPDGTQNASRLQMTLNAGTTTSDYAVQQHAVTTVVSGASYSYSIFLKSNTASNYIVLARDDAASGATSVLWTVTPTWQRFTYTATTSTTSSNGPKLWLRGGLGTSTSADLLIYGAQLEAGAFATSYIPNLATGSTTRNADVAAMTGTNFSAWWTSTIGGLAARVIPSIVTGTRPAVQFDDNTSNNIITLRGNVTAAELYVKATTDQAQINAGVLTANTLYSLAGAWNTDNCAASVNGAAAVTDLSATIPTVTQARLGSDGTNYLNGWLQTVRYWPQRITNAEVQAFSKL